jgi:hypothetical protein
MLTVLAQPRKTYNEKVAADSLRSQLNLALYKYKEEIATYIIYISSCH